MFKNEEIQFIKIVGHMIEVMLKYGRNCFIQNDCTILDFSHQCMCYICSMSSQTRCIIVFVNQTKMEVRLPVTTKAKFMWQMLVHKERGFIQVQQDLGEWLTSITKPISFARPR